MTTDLRVAHIGWTSNANGPGYKTVAWCDINEKKLADNKARYPHIAMYTDYREMIRNEKLDVVFISTPNFVHTEQAIAFLDAGVHVFLEKPMGINKAECDAVLQAAARNNRLCVIDFELRISFFARRLKQVVDGGAYGALKRIEFIHYRGCWLEEGNGIWRTRADKSGGLFFMEPIHEVDIFRQFAGEITAVQAIAGPNVLPQYRFEDNVCSHFFFASGAVGTLLSSHTHSAYGTEHKHWTRDMGHSMDLILTFEKGSVGVDMIALRMTFNRYAEYPAGTGAFRVEFERIEDYAPLGITAFAHDISTMHQLFLQRLIAGQEPVVTTLDAWKSHMVCLAAETSIREEGRRVAVDFTLPPGVRA
jgi:predicted dehydrogenase